MWVHTCNVASKLLVGAAELRSDHRASVAPRRGWWRQKKNESKIFFPMLEEVKKPPGKQGTRKKASKEPFLLCVVRCVFCLLWDDVV